MASGDGDYFIVSPTDRSMAILDRTSPVPFHVIWDLLGTVDLDALDRAWQDLAIVHPILGCSTDIDVGSRWTPGRELPPVRQVDQRLARASRPSKVSSVDQKAAGELASPMDLDREAVVRLSAIKMVDGFRLVLAAHHAAIDGVASVLLLEDLRRLYVGRISGAPDPPQADLSPRTVEGLIQQARLPLLERQSVIAGGLDRWRRLPPSAHVDPSPDPPPGGAATEYVTFEVGPVLATYEEQRRRNNWSVDAVLVGVLEAAWTETFGSGDGASVWLVAQDLRPGFGVRRGLGNLSGAEPIAIRTPHLRPVELLIEQAAAEMAITKSNSPGLAPELMARSWGWMPPQVLNRGAERMIRSGLRNRYTRTLSNLGRLPNSFSDWGHAGMATIRFVGPLAKGPYTSFIAFAHGSSSWLTVRVSEGWLTTTHAVQLERAMHRDLTVRPLAGFSS
ncbi:MAG: condensation domain-containing protein [Acidimicrobiia bacterium]